MPDSMNTKERPEKIRAVNGSRYLSTEVKEMFMVQLREYNLYYSKPTVRWPGDYAREKVQKEMQDRMFNLLATDLLANGVSKSLVTKLRRIFENGNGVAETINRSISGGMREFLLLRNAGAKCSSIVEELVTYCNDHKQITDVDSAEHRLAKAKEFLRKEKVEMPDDVLIKLIRIIS